jgi:hypothetical protein
VRATIRSLGVIPLAALAVAAKVGAQVRVEFTPFAGAAGAVGDPLRPWWRRVLAPSRVRNRVNAGAAGPVPAAPVPCLGGTLA